jgi:hypothetical protein
MFSRVHSLYDFRMSLIKDHAVILRRLDFSENSQVLALFTRDHGKVRAIAKGVKRSTKTRFAPAPDLLDVGSAVLSAPPADRDRLAILTEWTPTQPLTGSPARRTDMQGRKNTAYSFERIDQSDFLN